ncbi:hypothetical protein ES702_01242 [subsurface metagenome]
MKVKLYCIILCVVLGFTISISSILADSPYVQIYIPGEYYSSIYLTEEHNSSNLWDSLDTPANINLTDLGDVNAGAPTDDQLLSWDDATARWIARTVGGINPWLIDTLNGYLYNDTDTLYFNETQLNVTIDLRASAIGGNSSWNESKSLELHYLRNEVDSNLSLYLLLTNQKFNETNLINSINTTANIQTLGFYDKSEVDANLSLYRLDSWDNLTGIPHATPSDGDTTHFSLADEIYDWVIGLTYITNTVNDLTNYYLKSETDNNFSLYYPKTDIDTNFSNYILTTEESNLNVNSSDFWDDLDSPLASWLSTYNATYDANIDTNCTDDGSCPLITYDSELTYTTDTSAYVNCSADEVFLGNGSCMSTSVFVDTDTNATTECGADEVLDGDGDCVSHASWLTAESDPVWQGNYSIFTGLISNWSYLSTYNVTYNAWINNNTVYDGLISNASYLSTYNATYDAQEGNLSWNESYAREIFYNKTALDINLSSYIKNNTVGWTLNFTEIMSKSFITDSNSFIYDFKDDGSNLILDLPDVGGNNYFGIETTGGFFQLYANPNAGNDYLLATITETQGADTEINFYEGGTGHNRFYDSGSMRVGGGASRLCSNLTTDVDCDTPSTGADLVVQDDGWFGGKLFSYDWTNVTIIESQISDLVHTGNLSWNESHADTLYRDIAWDNFTGIPVATPSDGDTTHLSSADHIWDWVKSLLYITTADADTAFINATGDSMTGNLNFTDNNATGFDYIKFTDGGYIYDNSTSLILGHS